MMRKTQLLVILLLVAGAALVTAQSTSPQALLQRGMQEFQRTQYRAALQDFRDVILNPQYAEIHGDAYYWVSLSYIALNQLGDAEKNLEYFLLNYRNNPNIPNAYYQKGRLLYLQNEYQNSIQVLYTFIKSYKSNPYVANAYYWIGESLYSLGHFQDAAKVFQVVVSQYPTSYKIEAAKYRLSVIDLRQREIELMKLLRWSHEAALNAQEDFNQKEQAYEQAIIAYQKKIAQLESTSTSKQVSVVPSTTNKQMSDLKNQISQLQAQVLAMSSSAGSASASGSGTASSTTTQSLLALKAEALTLKETYLDWLSSQTGASQ